MNTCLARAGTTEPPLRPSARGQHCPTPFARGHCDKSRRGSPRAWVFPCAVGGISTHSGDTCGAVLLLRREGSSPLCTPVFPFFLRNHQFGNIDDVSLSRHGYDARGCPSLVHHQGFLPEPVVIRDFVPIFPNILFESQNVSPPQVRAGPRQAGHCFADHGLGRGPTALVLFWPTT